MVADATDTSAISPDTPASGETLVQLLSRTYHALVPQFERHVGMSRARWAVLTLLQREGEISQTAIQQQLSVDGAAITRQVKQLEEEGLALRRAAPHDNRFTLVALTPAGQALAASMDDQRQSFEAIVGAGLEPGDVAALRRCLIQIRENMLARHAML